ncbi:AbrB family transcriptional regulator [Niveispirillum sp.]|uniref:AbrB/MazE/SpoVT family DNA-binding domain-containing protein n=1 Tax=Niveispirillum sp. TaxID=1917217 RepID=UPI001B5F41A6|nr:AbrB family transcriptional regulator [Niveispirillum sp.]MBP7338752.1 AbrB family transcriptional regulator [Niveispirillum sp.]
MQLARWDDGLAVRLPEDVMQKLALKKGYEVDIHAARIHMLEVFPKVDAPPLIEKLRSLKGTIPSYLMFDRTRQINILTTQ